MGEDEIKTLHVAMYDAATNRYIPIRGIPLISFPTTLPGEEVMGNPEEWRSISICGPLTIDMAAAQILGLFPFQRKISRKRFIKLLMSHRVPARLAKEAAALLALCGLSYAEAWERYVRGYSHYMYGMSPEEIRRPAR